MAKRFTDTEKWAKAWFRKLPPKLKCAWLYLCDRCDHAGLWEIDLEALEFHVGEVVTISEILDCFGDRIQRVSADKLSIPPFVDFQYGALDPANRVHKSVISKLDKYKNKDLGSPLEGAKDKDKDKYKEKEKDKDKETARARDEKDDPKFKLSAENLARADEAWFETLAHFGMRRTGLLQAEQYQLASAIQRYGINALDLALRGARHEPKSESFDPAKFVSLKRYLSAEGFERFVNLGVAAKNEANKRTKLDPSLIPRAKAEPGWLDRDDSEPKGAA